MYKLLIVDDELHIRNGLVSLIEWEIYGIEIAGTAEDGMKAYLAIKELGPDLVLIDISMPNMNGLELIELCTHLELPPKFIILSGYNDFSYVQKAIHLGALDYLLKPIDQYQLCDAISSSVKKLDDFYAHQQNFQESLLALRNDILMRILHTQIEIQEFQEKCQITDISLRCRWMRVGVFTLYFPDNAATHPLLSAVKLIQDSLLGFCSCYVVSDVNTNIAVIFKDPLHNFTEADYLTALSNCSDELSAQLKLQCLFALGREVNNIRQLSDSYQDCISKLEKKLILGDAVEEHLSRATPSPSVHYPDFLKYLEVEDAEKFQELLHTFCRSLLQTTASSDMNFLKYHLIDLATFILRSKYMGAYFSPEVEQKKQQIFSLISKTDAISELEKTMTRFFLLLADYTPDASIEAEYPPLIRKVTDHIRKHYSDSSLSLKTLAAKLEVNPAYLGREFALATGEYFNDYLNRIRIAKASHLLGTTSQKAVKIADSVGFTNASYFFTIFKKLTGQSPNDYRSTHSLS